MQTALDLRRALRSAETKRRSAQAMRRKLRCMSAEACQRQPGVDVKRSLQDRSPYVAVGRTPDLQASQSKGRNPAHCRHCDIDLKRSCTRTMTMHVLRANLRHFDSRSAFPVQQSPQMILRKRVRRGFADQCGEGGERAWIAGLSLREGVGIGQGATAFALLGPQRLENPHGLGPSPQEEIADRAADKSFCALSGGGADADARAELLVDCFEPRGR